MSYVWSTRKTASWQENWLWDRYLETPKFHYIGLLFYEDVFFIWLWDTVFGGGDGKLQSLIPQTNIVPEPRVPKIALAFMCWKLIWKQEAPSFEIIWLKKTPTKKPKPNQTKKKKPNHPQKKKQTTLQKNQ